MNTNKIKARIRHLGYSVSESNGLFTLRPSDGPSFIHNKFRSLIGAADYLVQLTHDDALRELVSGLQ